MIKRNGFVSNSSSSSFIVSVENNGPCPTCGCEPTTFIDNLQTESWNVDGTYLIGYGVKEIREELGDRYGWEDDVETNEHEGLIAELQKLEDEGHKVYYLQIAYSDYYLSKLLVRNKDIIVHWRNDE